MRIKKLYYVDSKYVMIILLLMKKLWLYMYFFFSLARSQGMDSHSWEITSPQQAQTFTYGSERDRQWIQRSNHLGVVLHFTNDPYVDRTEPRQYDDFEFDFPAIKLGVDRRTFFYHPDSRHSVPVAAAHPGLFGSDVRLLSTSELLIQKPHGRLTLVLLVTDRPGENPNRGD